MLKDALARFVAWSRSHPNAACPDAAALGVADDPWGHPLAITCTEQPSDQIAGAVSAGPDGNSGTADDIASWQLDRDITELVHGPRWVAAPARRNEPRSGSPAPSAPAKPGRAVELDENGMPIRR